MVLESLVIAAQEAIWLCPTKFQIGVALETSQILADPSWLVLTKMSSFSEISTCLTKSKWFLSIPVCWGPEGVSWNFLIAMSWWQGQWPWQGWWQWESEGWEQGRGQGDWNWGDFRLSQSPTGLNLYAKRQFCCNSNPERLEFFC